MKQKPAQQNILNIQLRPASVEEAGLFYSQMEEGEDRSLGTVGHLRMDFGREGQEFWSSWWKHNGDHFNTPEFRKELQQVVDELRRSGPLKDLKTMRSYCDSHGGAIEDIYSPSGFAKEKIRSIMDEAMVDQVLTNLNLYRYGESLMESEHCTQTGYGLLQRRDGQKLHIQDKHIGMMEMRR